MSKKILLIAFSLIFAFFCHAQDTAWKQEILEQVNEVRSEGCRCGRKYYKPAPPVTWNNLLESAANGHAADMYKKKYFSHKSKNGKGFSERIDDAGYTWIFSGENIAQGQKSVTQVLEDWLDSPTHCVNIMNPDYKEMGVSKVGDYWVQEFGTHVPKGTRLKKK